MRIGVSAGVEGGGSWWQAIGQCSGVPAYQRGRGGKVASDRLNSISVYVGFCPSLHARWHVLATGGLELLLGYFHFLTVSVYNCSWL